MGYGGTSQLAEPLSLCPFFVTLFEFPLELTHNFLQWRLQQQQHHRVGCWTYVFNCGDVYCGWYFARGSFHEAPVLDASADKSNGCCWRSCPGSTATGIYLSGSCSSSKSCKSRLLSVQADVANQCQQLAGDPPTLGGWLNWKSATLVPGVERSASGDCGQESAPMSKRSINLGAVAQV
jgi:hypothetical protein